MAFLKHVGRIRNNKRRCIVAYRTLPGDATSALIVMTESLPADEHDALIKLVESPAGQDAEELALAMARSYLPDGRNMLSGFHSTGHLKKVPTSDIEMTPDTLSTVNLDELNRMIAQQKGVSVDELAITDHNGSPQAKPTTTEPTLPVVEEVEEPTKTNEVLSDEDLAKQLRSQADTMFKEAQRLRKEAEVLSPTKRKTTRKAKESVE